MPPFLGRTQDTASLLRSLMTASGRALTCGLLPAWELPGGPTTMGSRLLVDQLPTTLGQIRPSLVPASPHRFGLQ